MVNMPQKLYGKRIKPVIAVLLMFILAACGTSSGTTQSKSMSPSTSTGQTATTIPVVSTPTHDVATPSSTKSVGTTPTPQNNPSSGPSIILTPTPAPGGGQQVTFPDRIVVIGNVSKQSSIGNSTPVSLTLTVKNTGTKPILNQATFFQLVGSEGDVFGYQSSVTPGFYGTISPQGERNGTVVFLVPTGAMSGGLRLLYRSEIDTETVFVRLPMV